MQPQAGADAVTAVPATPSEPVGIQEAEAFLAAHPETHFIENICNAHTTANLCVW